MGLAFVDDGPLEAPPWAVTGAGEPLDPVVSNALALLDDRDVWDAGATKRVVPRGEDGHVGASESGSDGRLGGT